MNQFISPLGMILKELVPYFQEFLTSKLGTKADLILITKVGDRVEMRDTLGDNLGLSIMMLEGVLDSLKGGKVGN